MSKIIPLLLLARISAATANTPAPEYLFPAPNKEQPPAEIVQCLTVIKVQFYGYTESGSPAEHGLQQGEAEWTAPCSFPDVFAHWNSLQD